MVGSSSYRLETTKRVAVMKDSPASIALLLVVLGVGCFYYSVNMVALGLGRGAIEGQVMLEFLALSGLGLSGSVAIGAGLLFGRLRARGSLVPMVASCAALVCSLLTMFFPGLCLSCYLVYLLREEA